MIVIDVLAFLFVVFCVIAAIRTVLDKSRTVQIERADRLILRIQVTDEVMTFLPAQIRADIDTYAATYIHGGKEIELRKQRS